MTQEASLDTKQFGIFLALAVAWKALSSFRLIDQEPPRTARTW
jgi:hypothetical protein